MTLENFKKAVHLIETNKNEAHFIGPRPAKLVHEAELALGLKFSKLYRYFLSFYGAGSFGAEEIYGVIDEDFKNSSVPDAIWFTLSERKESNFPKNLLVIYATGWDGEIFCLDFNKLNTENEPPVVSFFSGMNLKDQTYEKIAEDFGDFLLQRVEWELKMIEEDKMKT